MRTLFAWCVATVVAATGTQANATWYQASSKHFVIYSDNNPRQLQSFASTLERFDQAVRAVMHYDDPPVGDGNRLTVFVLPTVGAVQKLAGKQTGDIDTSTVFFHEYTHHLQFENLDRPYPVWLVEGFATFMQTAKVQKDGSVLLGAAPEERAWGLLGTDSIP